MHAHDHDASEVDSQRRRARIENDRVILDLRTVDPADDTRVASAFGSVGPNPEPRAPNPEPRIPNY